ncbi:Trm112 family protein [Streptomyces sp. NPDC058171]
MNPDDPLLDLLVCPLDKGPLHLVPATRDEPPTGCGLYNPRLRLLYPVLDGVPRLLPSSGAAVSPAAHERLVAAVDTG